MKLVDVLRKHWDGFTKKHRSSLCNEHYRAANSVMTCRTLHQGGHLKECSNCQTKHYHYHSCNHRNCSQCGSYDQMVWTLKQEAKLLPSPYFLVTFTLPAELRPLARKHPKILYDLLLSESAATLQEVAQTKLKAKLGFTSVLHTWGRQLQYHPHVHLIIPAIGYQEETQQLVHPKKASFLLSNRPLAKRFAIRLSRAILEHPELQATIEPEVKKYLNTVHYKNAKPWVVHLQHAGNGKTAVRYLARYVHRSALSDRRIKGETPDGKIQVQWQNATTKQLGLLSLSPENLILRWKQHVLPKGFVRLRHFGFMSPASKSKRQHIRLLLGQFAEPQVTLPERPAEKCSHCGSDLSFSSKIERSISRASTSINQTDRAPP